MPDQDDAKDFLGYAKREAAEALESLRKARTYARSTTSPLCRTAIREALDGLADALDAIEQAEKEWAV